VDKKITFDEYSKAKFLDEVYMNDEKYEDITALLNRKKNIILQGAPGVGKSFLAKRLAYSMIGFKDTNKVEMVQFHQSYSYEDFIEGFRPGKSGNFEIKQGTFFRFCKKAIADSENKYFFIIDEINQGNISKIMGELMLLLENDKRGKEHAMSVTYSGDKFYVPDNVYVIGMMNTADRSLAMIDYALRRRFSFVPIEPAFDNNAFILEFRDNYHDADTVIEKMKKLNALIADELDNGHQIGHSYFCSDKPLDDKDIEGIFKYEIKELLHEYFFDNKNKLDEALAIL
jgi:5-methylcytosine-specific restriction protein B